MLWPRVLCRLLVKKVAGGTTTIYVYDGAALIAEYDGAGTLLRNHLNLSGVPLATLTPAGAQMAITYHASDHLSIRNDTDKDGTVVATQGHLPFGESWYADGAPSAFRFTNYIRDTTSGLDFAPYRAYETRLGVFTSIDPTGRIASSAGIPQSLGLYAYTLNNPISFVDPLGLCIKFVGKDEHGDWITVDDGKPCKKGKDEPAPTPADDYWFSIFGRNIYETPPHQTALQGPDVNTGGGTGNSSVTAQTSATTQDMCTSIQQNYNTAAMEIDAKWAARFYGSILIGGIVGGPVGAIGGGGVALLYDESRSEYNAVTQKAEEQWRAAGCSGNLVPRFR